MKLHFYPRLWFLLIVLSPLSAYPAALPNDLLEPLRDSQVASVDGVSLLSARLLDDFYARRGRELVWGEPARIDALRELAEDSRAEGFDPQDFHLDILRALSAPGTLASLTEAERASADIKLSDALLRYVHHTRYGKLDPVAVDARHNDRAPIPAEQLLADLEGALQASDFKHFLASRFQRPFWYQALTRALGRYVEQSHLADLPPLPSGNVLVRGSRDPRVALVRERLRLIGVQVPPATAGSTPEPGQPDPKWDPDRFDDGLRAQVVAFQKRFGLAPDGAVGPATLAALNQPFDADQLERIRINLERMRWLYNDLATDYLFVDVAGYLVHVVRNGEILWTTRAIVGEKGAQTPMFRDTMDHLVFNPTWTVPISIQKKMGRVSARYTLVDRRTGRKSAGGDASNYRRYRIVQQPGPHNALGRVKFMFPNRHSVYLHDTPNKGLFGRTVRALSHGCVRVQDPVRLAELLLQESDWDRARIDRTIGGGRTRYVNLDEDMPVLLYYLTAYADADAGVSFRPDFYGRDQGLREAFASPVLGARIAFPEPVSEPAEIQPAEKLPDTAPDSEPESGPESAPDSQDRVRLTQAEG